MKNKKIYEAPKCQVTEIKTEDIILASGNLNVIGNDKNFLGKKTLEIDFN